MQLKLLFTNSVKVSWLWRNQLIKASMTSSDYAKSASEAYSEAYDVSRSAMDPPHPIRLGLALNYSVFFYEIEDQKTKACEIAKQVEKKEIFLIFLIFKVVSQAFDEAIGDMESVKMSSFKDSSLILQLLRDNLTVSMTSPVFVTWSLILCSCGQAMKVMMSRKLMTLQKLVTSYRPMMSQKMMIKVFIFFSFMFLYF